MVVLRSVIEIISVDQMYLNHLHLLQTLTKRVVCQVRALVVLPVRELAVQVHKVFQSYCKGTHLKVGTYCK